ncbi:efflux RND transporter periplasmic adaptor subunit [Massilia sp. W12]|uniref:efflux RND transporter periplasmic adaptor subunit n=1 Tax=Massilia sp. W12 TaxID=3126507 RepID=UPI0030CD1CF8
MSAAISHAPAAVQLPALREDLQLQSAPRGMDGAPAWHLYDAVRNRFFRIGWLEFEMLSRWRAGRQAQSLADEISADTPLAASLDDVQALLQFLNLNQLLSSSQPAMRKALYQFSEKQKLSIWQWFLHHYLFFRVPLIRPEKFLVATIPALGFIFRPAFLWLAAGLGLLGAARVLDQWSAFSATFLYFFSWQGVLLYGLALALAKTLHEFAHAYVAKYYGLRVPTMGVAFMMLWPLLYTDTSEGWKLQQRRARLAIGGAGIIAELLLAGLAALLWSILPEGGLKSAAYLLAAVTWISTLAINLNPFMRFDGYYLLMDAVDLPNLHERAFAFGRWQLRRWLLGVDMPVPEAQLEHKKNWLIAYAWLTWLYRLVLFIGIAVAVYYFFFKLAGVILFAVEIGWFVLRPLWQEMRAWRELRPHWRRRRVWLSLLLGGGCLIVLALPWRSQISAPGMLQAAQHTRLYPHSPARLQQVLVKPGAQVAAGTLLFVLQAPELLAQEQALQARIAGLQAQLERAIGNPALLERQALWSQELQQAQAMLSANLEEQQRLRIKAPHQGQIMDLAPGLYPGRWLNAHSTLAQLVDGRTWRAQVYVEEADVARIAIGANAHILLRRADTRRLAARVVDIDKTPSRQLPLMLASTHGGPLAARAGEQGQALANDALYRITLEVQEDLSLAPQVIAAQAEIEGENSSPLWQWGRRIAGVLVRESGF